MTLPPVVLDLLRQPCFCQVATMMPDGSPQVTHVWVDTDGTHVVFNTSEGRQKIRNIRRDPRFAMSLVDPASFYRRAYIRGRVVEVTAEGAEQHIAALSLKYLGKSEYALAPGEQRLIVRIAPEHVSHSGLTPTD